MAGRWTSRDDNSPWPPPSTASNAPALPTGLMKSPSHCPFLPTCNPSDGDLGLLPSAMLSDGVPEHGRQASQTVSIGIPLRGNFPDSGESDAIPLLGSQLPDLQACILEVGAGVGDVVALIWLGQPDQIMLTGPFFRTDPLLPVTKVPNPLSCA